MGKRLCLVFLKGISAVAQALLSAAKAILDWVMERTELCL